MGNRDRTEYFKFLSRLFEIAADFDPSRLDNIRKIAVTEQNQPAVLLADSLQNLHGQKAEDPDRSDTKGGPEEGLREILSSKTIFKTNQDLWELVVKTAIDIPSRSKESRERFVTRILKSLAMATQRRRHQFQSALEKHISRENGDTDFVSRWTRVIRDM